MPRSQRSFSLLHSAQESRVAPRLRFLAGSGPGDGSRLLGDGVDIGVGIGNEEARIEAWRYIGRDVMNQVR